MVQENKGPMLKLLATNAHCSYEHAYDPSAALKIEAMPAIPYKVVFDTAENGASQEPFLTGGLDLLDMTTHFTEKGEVQRDIDLTFKNQVRKSRSQGDTRDGGVAACWVWVHLAN